jgi:hypothetical protein
MAVYRRSILWRLACEPAARLWSGVGDIFIPASRYDPDGAIYRGAGALLQVPTLKALMNGLADRVDFGVSGVSAETLRLALDDRESVQGAELNVGYVSLDNDEQPTKVIWQWRGYADVLTTQSQASEGGRERSISLSVANADTLRSNPQISRYTDADQRRKYPTDAFFSHVAGIAAGDTRRFGPK